MDLHFDVKAEKCRKRTIARTKARCLPWTGRRPGVKLFYDIGNSLKNTDLKNTVDDIGPQNEVNKITRYETKVNKSAVTHYANITVTRTHSTIELNPISSHRIATTKRPGPNIINDTSLVPAWAVALRAVCLVVVLMVVVLVLY